MNWKITVRGFLGLVVSVWPLAAGEAAQAAVDFDRDVRPILSERCFTCHGPDDGTRVNALRFDEEDAAFARLANGGFAIVRGNARESVLLDRVTSNDPVRRMPPGYKGFEKLPEKEIEVLRSWIEQGATLVVRSADPSEATRR
jgi:hypothetical protein